MQRRFSQAERRVLLATPRIGEIVVARLEAAGFHSLRALLDAGADVVTQRVTHQLGTNAWRNRRRAIEQVIVRATQLSNESR